jgi:hypothetical protein
MVLGSDIIVANMNKLLTRDEFREAVFKRDGHRCVICKEEAQDAHHIIERRLWADGGYYVENGASVCGACHILAEQTNISVESIRDAAGITRKLIPDHLYGDIVYDKWGNIVLENGNRLKGELFEDVSVQKILSQGGVLHLFVDKVKYPRTYHLPWSENMNDDDRMMSDKDMEWFKNQHIVITEKMDGENTTMYRSGIHARSVNSRSHISQEWVKNFHASIAYEIPEGWRICGENLYAKHSIEYQELPSYFLGFSIWDDQNMCLSWDQTLEWFELLGITPVREMYRGIFENRLHEWMMEDFVWEKMEGYVLRPRGAFHYKDFRYRTAKFVRKNHIQTVQHWKHGQPVTPNKLRKP